MVGGLEAKYTSREEFVGCEKIKKEPRAKESTTMEVRRIRERLILKIGFSMFLHL